MIPDVPPHDLQMMIMYYCMEVVSEECQLLLHMHATHDFQLLRIDFASKKAQQAIVDRLFNYKPHEVCAQAAVACFWVKVQVWSLTQHSACCVTSYRTSVAAYTQVYHYW
jgi:hypothetical protein